MHSYQVAFVGDDNLKCRQLKKNCGNCGGVRGNSKGGGGETGSTLRVAIWLHLNKVPRAQLNAATQCWKICKNKSKKSSKNERSSRD